MNYRWESDSIGEMQVPSDAYYGVQSLRGCENFDITGHLMHPELIRSLAKVKKAAALTNEAAGFLESDVAQAIVQASDEIIEGRFHDAFIVDAIQGGAGTSANMNANEVIANRAGELLGDALGSYAKVHPNDHVNMAQSTNDVYPSAGKLTLYILLQGTIRELAQLRIAFLEKAEEFRDVIKVGRTQLQDAVPMRLGQSFKAFAQAVGRDLKRLEAVAEEMTVVNMGGTAIGTGINASPYYIQHIAETLTKVCGFKVYRASDLIDATQNLDAFAHVSACVKVCALTLSKIANDLRLLSSGPRTGVAEINLPARQNGSSIMPGKVNPVIPEVVNQVAFNIMGNDVCVSAAVEAGQLELNAFEPVLFYRLFESIETLGKAAKTFTNNCVKGITANRDSLDAHLNESLVVVTALCPYIGYTKAASLAKIALKTRTNIRDLVLEEGLMDQTKLDEILDPQRLAEAPIEE